MNFIKKKNCEEATYLSYIIKMTLNIAYFMIWCETSNEILSWQRLIRIDIEKKALLAK